MHKIFLFITMVILGIISINVGASIPKEHPPTTQVSPVVVEEAKVSNSIIDLTNKYRTENGLSILVEDTNLNASAQEKAQDLCDNQYWAHDRPDGTPFSEVIKKHTSYYRAGENLAKGFTDNESTIVGWKNSPTHNQNMLEMYWDSIGVGTVDCKDGNTYTAQHFKQSL